MLNLSAGPVMMESEILKLGAEQIPYFRTNEFSKILFECESLLLNCVNAPKDSRVLFLTGSGTTGMEASIINVFDKNDKVLIVNGGSFGKRFKEICDIYNIDHEVINLEFGEPLKQEHLSVYKGSDFTGFIINAHETSTGVLYDMEIVRSFCEQNDLVLIVDAISTFLADTYDMKINGSNITILSSQKALALPPGLSMILADKKAQKRILANKPISLYLDLKTYMTDGLRGQTPYTPAVSIILQLRMRLEQIKIKGVHKLIDDVEIISKDFRNRIKELPFECIIKSPSNAITTLSPNGKMSPVEICNYLKENYSIFIMSNGGDLKDKVFRVGHIGAISISDNDKILSAFTEMNELGIL